MEITLILHNIRSAHNVGAILRTADGFGVKNVIFSGYTPRYNDPALLPHLREKLNHQISKTALGAETYLNLEFSENIEETLRNLRETHVILGLENNLEDARKFTATFDNLSQFRSALQSAEKQRSNPENTDFSKNKKGPKIALLLGEEVEGIPKNLYGHIDLFLEIPMHGKKESFNVSVATGIALFYLENSNFLQKRC